MLAVPVGIAPPAALLQRNTPDPAQSVKVNTMGGDTDGIGHFKARNDTGAIIYTMLNGDCKKISCQGSYRGGPVQAN